MKRKTFKITRSTLCTFANPVSGPKPSMETDPTTSVVTTTATGVFTVRVQR
ncbi:hypothetical protein HH214_10485 [Mucilaginibacter robiniae]|uniref:Uncharacterized protein n=1 Tax=Mucilaginibacter robiniae TaxID=2728022 RepID=A0A7L5DYS8_9SPHI|nr:hypothetical protein [Mucilaginibacter robiniae]QJD96260.1 hypothetical protein HH214_10485 [Mucilaginibacter robiniae]